MKLEFNEEKHEFTLAGQKLPSVTTMLKSVGIIDDRWFTESAAEAGSRRHLLTELYDKGVLDWGTVAPVDLPYLQAWIELTAEFGLEFTGIEEKMYHAVYLYAGIVDRVGRSAKLLSEFVGDIKTGKSLKWHSLQLTLYGMLSRPETYREEAESTKLLGFYLSKDGYKVKEYPWEISACEGILRVIAWKVKNGFTI